ncbi:hypothetical protein [Brevundimonas lutea]|uniref:hypothetical protein n=1 Tax=Brevundimonas lutea TaxID=2293980 RepID=UPI001F0C7509|nr:hypothetical protein [Brevundimonas lutea]
MTPSIPSPPDRDRLATTVAADLRAVERSADETLARLGALLQTLPETRLAGGLASSVGHDALVSVGEATRDLVRFRGRLIQTHSRLSRAAGLLGARPDPAVLGPLLEKGDIDEIGTTRPQGVRSRLEDRGEVDQIGAARPQGAVAVP